MWRLVFLWWGSIGAGSWVGNHLMELLWEDCLCSGLQLARKAIEELGACIYFFLCSFCCCFFFFFQLPWRLGDLNCTSVAGLWTNCSSNTYTGALLCQAGFASKHYSLPRLFPEFSASWSSFLGFVAAIVNPLTVFESAKTLDQSLYIQFLWCLCNCRQQNRLLRSKRWWFVLNSNFSC